MITCDSFHHIWLNEGFAEYSEAMWFEHAYSPYTASEYLMDYQLYLGDGTIYVEDPQNENIFERGLTYYKASWVLHMLRHIVGDDLFINIMRTYYSSPEHQYETATTEDFQAICEQEAEMDLDQFFHQWIYEEYFPYYAYSWDWVQNGSQFDIQLEIQQLQENYIFRMPIDITVTTTQGVTTFIVLDSLQTQAFQLTVMSEPVNLELDKDNWILKMIQDPFVDLEFNLYQNYPNPFNSTTIIEYDLPKNTRVHLTIYNVLGQTVRTLVNEYQTLGNKSVVWDGTDNSAKPVSSGLYFYMLETAKLTGAKKMVLLR